MNLTTQYNKSYLMVLPKIKILAIVVPEKSGTKFNWRKEKNRHTKGMIIRRHILSYTKQLVIPNIHIKFLNSTYSGS